MTLQERAQSALSYLAHYGMDNTLGEAVIDSFTQLRNTPDATMEQAVSLLESATERTMEEWSAYEDEQLRKIQNDLPF